jgi:superfamily I DNA/RNA helicase
MNSISKIDALNSGLNIEQQAAVTAGVSGHLLILAGAGCGKTTVLTRRIAYLCLSGIDQNRILALTFTKKAADEMVARVRLLDGLDRNNVLPLITTFHGFGLRVLSESVNGKQNFNRIGFKGNLRLIDERERLELLAAVSTAAERKSLGADLCKLDDLLSKKAVFPEKLTSLGVEQIAVLSAIEQRLAKKMRLDGLWDFSDLITGLMQLYREYPDVIEHYAKKYDVILVDEFQDTNPMQINILNFLISGGARIFAVGDDDQAIYGFRGADIRPTIDFCGYFKGAGILKLQTNYRSVPEVLDIANKLFKDKNPAYRKLLLSGRYKKYSGCKPSQLFFGNQKQMVEWVLKKAAFINRRDSIPVEKMVMLFRINQSIKAVSEFVLELGGDAASPQLLTVHRSKGLEFPVVFLCDLEEGVFPSYRVPAIRPLGSFLELIISLFKKKKKPEECDWEEEKRLFYVGITRAERYLFFMSVGEKPVFGRMRKFRHSSLLKLL